MVHYNIVLLTYLLTYRYPGSGVIVNKTKSDNYMDYVRLLLYGILFLPIILFTVNYKRVDLVGTAAGGPGRDTFMVRHRHHG